MNSNTIVTIGRQFGSGGHEIGEKLAKSYGIPCYDKELLARAAKESGFCEEMIKNHDERPTNSFLYNLVMDTYSMGYSTGAYVDMPIGQRVFLAQFDTIKEVAKEGACVIVGRCADYALSEQAECINIFIYADLDVRIKRIMEKYNVTKVFGIHIWPFLEKGVIASKRGAIMAKSAEIDIDILGESAHGTAAYEGKDALFIASDFMTKLYTRHAATIGGVPHFAEDIDPLPKSRPCKPEDKTIIHIGKMDSGYARNVVSNNTRLQGTVRAFSEESFDNTLKLITDTLSDITDQYGCDYNFTNSEGYPPIINDEGLYLKSLLAAKSLECGYNEITEPVMTSDDFSFYGHYAPAVFFLLGTGGDIPLHSVEFDFDEHILISGFELYKALLSC